MIARSKTLNPGILTEQFIPDHVFVYVAKGMIDCYDGDKNYTFKAGEYCIARKNRLARYKISAGFEFSFFCFDEAFLKDFQKQHSSKTAAFASNDTFIKIKHTRLLPDFINSLKSYLKKPNQLDEAFEGVKYTELLIILLRNQPELAGIFFDFGVPEKMNLEKFMNHNFTFNVSIDRFAFLTGRSLSAFKRDFKDTFNETPNRWLIKKRLQEAYFLIDKKKQKPTDIYIDLGFEDLSHFSFAFKKLFGLTPTELTEKKKRSRT
jgi:AraC family transcriptional regulator, exoenzyme S synthesis regulatory protein ExsA